MSPYFSKISQKLKEISPHFLH